MPEKGDVIIIEDAQLIWPNFRGVGSQFNSEGDRNFNVVLPKDKADALAADGWNVKCKLPRPEDEEQVERCVLKITVKFKVRPPRILMIGNKSRNRTELTEDLVGLLDDADIKKVDLSFVPYFWELATGATGVTAYLKAMYVEIIEDDLALKWAEPAED